MLRFFEELRLIFLQYLFTYLQLFYYEAYPLKIWPTYKTFKKNHFLSLRKNSFFNRKRDNERK